jgi:mono/diheme cytochrome c family protein
MRMCNTKRVLMTMTLVMAAAVAAPMPAAAQDAKKGAEVYAAQKCQMCHAVAGKGNKANPLDGAGAKLSADEIKQWITHPTEMTAKAKSTKKPPMPNKYGGLPAGDLDNLVAYIASLK